MTRPIDYDAPRLWVDEDPNKLLNELTPATASSKATLIDRDETELADSCQLAGADLSNEELPVHLVPVRPDEFTCMSCFLVHHRSQLAAEKAGNKYCTECAE